MAKPKPQQASWSSVAPGHARALELAVATLTHLAVARPSDECLNDLVAFFAQEDAKSMQELSSAIATVTVFAHRVRWYAAEEPSTQQNHRSVAAACFTHAVKLLHRTIEDYQKRPETWSIPDDLSATGVVAHVSKDRPYVWDDDLAGTQQQLICPRTGQSSVLILPLDASLLATHVFDRALGVRTVITTSAMILVLQCIQCIQANAVCTWPAETVSNCNTCTKNCKVHTDRKGPTETLTRWKSTDDGKKVYSAIRAARPTAPPRKHTKQPAKSAPSDDILPTDDDPVFHTDEEDEFDDAFENIVKSIDTMKANANRLEAVQTQLAPLVENSQRKAGIIVGAGFYPTHVAVGPIAAHYAKASRDIDQV